MKISVKGYKDNSPDNREKSLFINSNTLTMQGVSRPITAIPIVNGKPDYTQRVMLKPGDPDYTNPKASGFIEIPNAQMGIQMGTGLPQSPFKTNMDGSITYDGFQTLAQQYGDFTQPKTPNIALPQDMRSFDNYSKMMVGNENQMDERQYNRLLGNDTPSNFDQYLGPKSLTAPTYEKESSEDKMARMLGALSDSNTPDLQSSLQTLGWSIGFNPSEFGHLSQGAQKKLSGLNTGLGIASAGNALLKGAFDVFSGMGAGKRDTEDRASMVDKWTKSQKRQNTFYSYQEGGQTKVLTEGYTTGLPQGSPLEKNAEVEKGEFLKDPNTGQVTEVLGKRHSQGGEMMNLEGGTKVISDYLEIGSALVRELRKEFDLKNLTPKSTFATAVKRFRDKIGLTKKYNEVEKTINKIKDQEEVENENTKDLNLQHLSSTYRSQLEELEPLETQIQRFTDYIFEHQEYTKALKKDKERFNELKKGGVFQEGGQINPEQVSKIVDAFCDMTGNDPTEVEQELSQMTPEEVQQALQMMIEAIEQGGAQQQPEQMEEPMMQEGGEITDEDVQQLVQAFAQATGANPEEIMQKLQQMSPEEQQQALQQMAQMLQEQMQGGQEQMAPQEQGMMQEGGEQQGGEVEQIIMMFAQATRANPEEIMQELQQMPPEEQQQALQEMVQFLEQQEQQAPEEQPMMQEGGEQQGGKMGWFKKQALKFLGKNLEKELTNEDSWHKDNKTLINDSVKWNKEFIDSPKYREMLSKYISEDEIEEELRSRKENINKGFVGVPDTLALNSPYTSVYIPEFSNMLPDIPVINKNKGKVAISTEDAKARLIPDPFSVYGEVSKQSTQGGKKVPNKVFGEWINKYVNQEHLDNKKSPEKVINKYDKVVFPNERNLTYKGGELHTSYKGNPTNILGFVNSLRAELEAEGVYDPKAESFNGEWIENYNRNYEDNFRRLNSLESLLDVVNPQWKDKGINKEDSVKIGNMMNEIVSNKKGVETSNFYAQEGGETSPDLGQVILAYSQMTGEDPQTLAQSLQELSEEELQEVMNKMINELQNAG